MKMMSHLSNVIAHVRIYFQHEQGMSLCCIISFIIACSGIIVLSLAFSACGPGGPGEPDFPGKPGGP